MIFPPEPKNELERIKDLKSYSILDSLLEEDYDNLTAIAAELCNTKISLISIIDSKRQWLKSHHGIDLTETPRELAFCAHAINKPNEIFLVSDARVDGRFFDHPYVVDNPNIVFYAGVPLISEAGFPLGTLCVIDDMPKVLTESQLSSLTALSSQAMKLIELRKKKILLEEALKELKETNQNLEQFAFVAAHDLKSPLNSIYTLSDIVIKDYNKVLDKNGQEILNHIKSAAFSLSGLIDGLLNYSRSNKILTDEIELIVVHSFITKLKDYFISTENLKFYFKTEIETIECNSAAIYQIMINLISNAIKYNDKDEIVVNISISEKGNFYKFSVADNGIGIIKEKHAKIFELYEVLNNVDRFGKKGNGIGLATVKRLVNKLGGEINLESELKKGSTFNFTIPKQLNIKKA